MWCTDQRHLEVTKFVPQVFHSVHTDQSSHEEANEFHAAEEVNKLSVTTAKLGSKYLVTQPIEIPVSSNHIHQSKENGLRIMLVQQERGRNNEHTH